MVSGAKKWGKRFLALLLGIVLAEATLGVAARLSPRVKYHLDQPWARVLVPDDVLGYRMSPYYPGNDAWGFRNKSVPEKCEILTVGDSVTYGFAAPADKSWPRQLEHKTGRSVYNIACGGYGPCEYQALLDKGLTLQPRTVLLGMHSGVGGDFLDAYRTVYQSGRFAEFRTQDESLLAQMKRADADRPLRTGESPGTSRSKPSSLREWMSQNSSLYALARELYPILAGKQFASIIREDTSPTDTYETTVGRPLSFPFEGEDGFRIVFRKPEFLVSWEIVNDPRFREGRKISEAILLAFQKKLAERQIRFAVIIVPSRELVLKDLISREPSLTPLLETIACEERIAGEFEEFLRQHRFEYLNTRNALQAGHKRGIRLYPETDDVHPNANGYTIIADAVAQFLAKTDQP